MNGRSLLWPAGTSENCELTLTLTKLIWNLRAGKVDRILNNHAMLELTVSVQIYLPLKCITIGYA